MKLSKTQNITAALGLFAVVLLYLLFVASPIQMAWGMTGLLLTELGLLALAVGAALLCRDPLQEVFPVRIPSLRGIAGAALLWVGIYPVVLLLAMVMAVLFPDWMGATAGGLIGMMTSVPLPVRYLIVAVSPAVCEEAVHRGFLRYHLRQIGPAWVQVLVLGLLFGLFHLDAMRFLSTAALGMVIAYAAVKTQNLVYPFLIHLLNNSLSVVSTLITEQAGTVQTAADAMTTITWQYVGVYLVFCVITPWLLWAGAALLGPRGRRPGRGRRALLCAAVSVLCLAAGAMMAA